MEIENYVPRISIVEEISNLFEQKNKIINITGISGNGKTFLARHFVQHYSEKFSHIVWLNCSEGLSKAFTEGKGAKLLDKIGLSAEHLSFVNGNMKVKSLVDMLLGRLQSIQGNSILILDNIDDEILFYKNELNLFSDWKILTTSQESLEDFCNYAIPSFEEEALKLFYKYYTLELDDYNLIRLLSSVEYHTLTIELLAKTAQQRQITIIELVNRFIEKGINVVEKISIIADHNIERENRVERKTKIENIEEYLNIVFDTSVLSEEECKILFNIAILQTEPIEINLFKEVYLNDSTDYKTLDIFEHNISILSSKGWIQIESDGIRLHGLVKSIIIKKLIHKNVFFDSTIQYLENILAKRHLLHDLSKMDYLKLSESVLENITEESKNLIYLQKGVSSFYTEIGLYEKSKKIELKYLNRLLEMPESERLPTYIVEVATQLHNLSIISRSQGKQEEALAYSEQLFSLFNNDTRIMMHSSLIDDLTLFFKENKLETPSEFENKFGQVVTIKIIEMFLSSFLNIVMFKEDKEDLLVKIKNLQTIISIRTQTLILFEQNIPEKIIFSIETYRNLLLSNATVFQHIGRYYLKLNDYDKAEKFIRKALAIEEKILDKDHHYFCTTYSHLTLLYLKLENMEEAKHFLDKTREICKELPPNSPYVIAYNESVITFKELQNKQFGSEHIEEIIQLKFEILYLENQKFTKLTEYYNIISYTFFEHKNYVKAIEYITKEINILLRTDEIEYKTLFHLYIRLGQCNLYLNDFDKVLKSYNNALNLIREKNVHDTDANKDLSDFKEQIFQSAFHTNYIGIINPLVSKGLKVLENKYIRIASGLLPKENLSVILNDIFKFLYELPDWGTTINEKVNSTKDMDLFLGIYDFLVVNLTKKYDLTNDALIQLNNIQYKILDDYYRTIIHLFLKYYNHNGAIQYYYKRLHLSEKHFEESISTGSIYYDISSCHFNLRQFELALENINKSIPIYSKASENKNMETTEIEEIKTFLKDALNLEKMIIAGIEEFKKR